MVRRARLSDAKEIQSLVNRLAKEEALLPLSLSSIFEHIRDFLVVEEDGKIIGCCALHIIWEDIAEIRSLAVEKEEQHKGYGVSLINSALKEAQELGLKKVFCLTTKPEFFKKLGFKEISKKSLPHKIWKDCIECSKFPECDEVALIYHL